MLDITDPPFP